jgi:thiol-disulfide isomerase/thioredoxin
MKLLAKSGVLNLMQVMILSLSFFSNPLYCGWLEAVSSKESVSPWVLSDLNGKEYQSKDLMGRTILVNFWTTWRPPCVEEMPSLIRLHQAMDRHGLIILAINVEESKTHVSKIARRLKLTFPVLLDLNRQVADTWKVRVFPSSF